MRVAYLGPEGTNSHEAALARYGERAVLIPYADLTTVVEAAADEYVDEALVPLENSTEGVVTLTADLLITGLAPPIVGESVLAVRHHLLARPGSTLAGVDRVISIPHAAAQCRIFLRTTLPDAQVLPAPSTAAAVAACVNSATAAAIGTHAAARIHGMSVLAADIQDRAANATRFVALGRARPSPTGNDRTSLVVGLVADRPGALVQALTPFATRSINLTMVGSRPTGEELGRYRFLVDCEGHAEDAPVAAALAEAEPVTVELRLLGSYPRAR